MNCPSLEELALIGGGDQPLTSEVDAHLKGCAKCLAQVEAFAYDSALLRIAPVVSDENLTALRQGVVAELRPKRSRLWLAAIAATFFIAVVLLQRPATKVMSPPTPMAKVEVAPVRPAPIQKAHRRHKRRAEQPMHQAKFNLEQLLPPETSGSAVYSGSVVVKMETADPDVTIILLGQDTGDIE